MSFLVVFSTLLVTAAVLFWNYSETRHRRLTKKPNMILDHWGKKSPKLDQEELGMMDKGKIFYGETILRYEFHLMKCLQHIHLYCVTCDNVFCSRHDTGFPGDVFHESSDWENKDVHMITNLKIGDQKSEKTITNKGTISRW